MVHEDPFENKILLCDLWPDIFENKGALRIETITEVVIVFDNVEEIDRPIRSYSNSLIRLLDYDIISCCDDLIIDETIDGMFDIGSSLGDFPLDFEEVNISWVKISEDNPHAIGRAFLSTAHTRACLNVININPTQASVEINRTLFELCFSDEEKETLLRKENFSIRDVSLNRIKKQSKKGSYATSFIKAFIGLNEEVGNPQLSEITEYILTRKFRNIHTGYAMGDIPVGTGVFTYDDIDVNNTEKKYGHVSFWKFRNSHMFNQIAKLFTYYDFD